MAFEFPFAKYFDQYSDHRFSMQLSRRLAKPLIIKESQLLYIMMRIVLVYLLTGDLEERSLLGQVRIPKEVFKRGFHSLISQLVD